MEIFTSYYAMLRKIDKRFTPISIAGRAPDWYKGLEYKKVAPKKDWFLQWKSNHDNEFYIQKYNETVLSTLKQEDVVSELEELSNGKAVVLICYEKPSDFCHRHIVADWLNEKGYNVQELVF